MIKILVIDDFGEILACTKEALEYLNPKYEVSCAKGGKEGILLATKEKPAVILLDIRMPDMDGFEVHEKLKEIPELKNTKIIVFTGEIRETRKGVENFDGYIAKPFDLETIDQKIREVLKSKKI